MIAREYHDRFQRAMASEQPMKSLDLLAHALRDEGMSQINLYLLFSHYYEQTSSEDPLSDAIYEALEAIYGGPWAKGRDLYAAPLTDEIIDAAGRKSGGSEG